MPIKSTGLAGSGAEVTFTVNNGSLQNITTTPAQGGSGYAPNATFDLSITGGGGTGGVVQATTNAQGQVISFATVPVQVGSGYTATTAGATANIALVLAANDNSTITATAVGASIAVGVSENKNAVAVAIGVSVANNTVNNTVSADLLNAHASATGAVNLTTSSDATITAVAVAASVSVAVGQTGVAVSGGGAESMNIILSTANAYLENSALTSGGNVSLFSNNSSDIEAHVVAVAVAIGFGSNVTGAGVAVGASIAQNYIGYTVGSDVNSPTPAQVQAYAQNSTITATGNLTLTANAAKETITATIVAAAAAISGGGKNGIGLAGSGAYVENRVATDIEAYIANVAKVQVVGGQPGAFESTSGSIQAANVFLTATDTSTITALAVGASLAGSYGGDNSLALSVGVSLASNVIRNQVAAYMLDADANGTNSQKVPTIGAVTLTTTENATISAQAVAASASVALAGKTGVALSGAGAEATNVILTTTNASIQDSSVATTGTVTINSTNTSGITATIVGASLSVAIGGNNAAGASIGVALASNYVGWNPDGSTASYDDTSDTVLPNGLTQGTTVEISSGVGAGNVYQYLGPTLTGSIDLKTQDYFDPSEWKQLNLSSAPAETEAYVQNSSIAAGGDLKVECHCQPNHQRVRRRGFRGDRRRQQGRRGPERRWGQFDQQDQHAGSGLHRRQWHQRHPCGRHRTERP